MDAEPFDLKDGLDDVDDVDDDDDDFEYEDADDFIFVGSI